MISWWLCSSSCFILWLENPVAGEFCVIAHNVHRIIHLGSCAERQRPGEAFERQSGLH